MPNGLVHWILKSQCRKQNLRALKCFLLKKSEKDFGGTSFPKKIVVLEKPGRTLCANINKTGTSQVGAISKAQKAQNILFGKKT